MPPADTVRSAVPPSDGVLARDVLGFLGQGLVGMDPCLTWAGDFLHPWLCGIPAALGAGTGTPGFVAKWPGVLSAPDATPKIPVPQRCQWSGARGLIEFSALHATSVPRPVPMQGVAAWSVMRCQAPPGGISPAATSASQKAAQYETRTLAYRPA